MTRRSKRDMELMQDDCKYYLLRTNNNYHRAYDLFIKDHLENNRTLPYYIKGIKDFLHVSQLLAITLNRMDQMDRKNKDKTIKDNEIKEYIKSMTKDEIRSIYKAYKDEISKSDKLVLHDVYVMVWNDCMDEKHIGENYVRLFGKIYNDRVELVG